MTKGHAREEELARRARLGDRDAFDQLCRKYRDRVLMVASLEGGAASDAGDIAQEAFLAALTAIGALRCPDRFGPWLVAIVRNRARMWRRADRSRPQAEPLSDAMLFAGSRSGSPETLLDLALTLNVAIRRLDSRHAKALRLHYWDGFTVAEIAGRLAVAPGTVKRWLHEARQQVRKELVEMGAAPAGAPRSRVGVILARSDSWEHMDGLKEALDRADCSALVNPDPVPDDVGVAVIDYEVEGGKGVEWLVYLRQSLAGLPIVMLGPTTERTMHACWAAGADVYMTVPFDTDELASLTRRAIEAAAAKTDG